MNHEMPGLTESQPMRQDQRRSLEIDIQNMIGPIVGIEKMSDAELYGMRDEVRANQRAVGADLLEPEM